jgi:hypothetical protein
MASKDLHNSIKVVPAFDIRAIASDTTTTGDVIDTQGYSSVEFVFQTGTVTDGDYTVLIEDADEAAFNVTNAAVADIYLLGTEAGASFTADTDDNDVSKIGYIGPKRYVRMSIVSTNTGGDSSATVGGICILGHPTVAPIGTQITRD